MRKKWDWHRCSKDIDITIDIIIEIPGPDAVTVVDVTIVAWKDVDEFDEGVDPGIGCELLPTLAPVNN